MSGFDLAQTFFIDADAVQKATVTTITSIDLYFYGKPTENQTKSGIAKPGIVVYLAGTNSDNSPDLSSTNTRIFARVEYDNINVSTTGSTATTFTFNKPFVIPTNRTYAFLISFDGSDPDFKMWYNKAGENKFGTTTATQTNSGKVDGYLFKTTNGKVLTPETDADLSFTLKVAKFTTTPTTFKVRNRPYEILKITPAVGVFKGGEPVYEKRANNTGTVGISSTIATLTGSGTSFNTILQAGDSFVITDGTTGNTDIRKVVSIANATFMTIDVTPSFTNTAGAYYRTVTGNMFFNSNMTDHLIVQDSTANASVYLSVGSQMYGVDSGATANITSIETYAINAAIPGFNVIVPAGTTVNTTLNFANSSLGVTSTTESTFTIGQRKTVDTYPAVIASRTTEVTTGTPFRSVATTLKFTTTNPYVSPYVQEENLDLFLETFEINNDDTNEYLGRGNASSRYISSPVFLSNDQLAEDMKVYIRAYRPANTSIKVYAKLRNTNDVESIDLKDWTEMVELTTTADQQSSSINKQNYIELQYDLPFEPAGTLVTGQFTTTTGNSIVTGTTLTVNTAVAVGSVVHVYSASTPNSYFIDTVVASNTTTFTLASNVSNTSMVGSGFLTDVVTRKNSAFIDVQKNNIATYFNSSLASFRGYDNFAIKVVLLSENGYAVPYVDDLRAVAVSA